MVAVVDVIDAVSCHSHLLVGESPGVQGNGTYLRLSLSMSSLWVTRSVR